MNRAWPRKTQITAIPTTPPTPSINFRSKNIKIKWTSNDSKRNIKTYLNQKPTPIKQNPNQNQLCKPKPYRNYEKPKNIIQIIELYSLKKKNRTQELTLIRIVSPRKSCSFSIVSGWSATTELSSLTASSTTRRFAAFLRSKIAVLKSLFVPLLKRKKKNETQESVNCWKICRSGNERLTNRRIRLGCSWCRIPCNDNVHRKKGKICEMGSEELGKGILGIYRERSSVSCIKRKGFVHLLAFLLVQVF